jgi:NTE family protein
MPKRALVLGGGGPVGIAWEAGVVLGLAESGVDLTVADHFVGTSAGAFVGARLALGHAPAAIAKPYQVREEPAADHKGTHTNGASTASAQAGLALLFQKIQEARRAGRTPTEIAREAGALALGAETISEDDFVARFIPALRADGVEGTWPERSFACTAFDAENGTFKVWDGAAGVDLASAVASSCAVPGVFPAITINGRRYFDGGVLSTTNAHLAAGHDAVLVLSVMEVLLRFSNFAKDKKTPLEREIEILREAGAEVHFIALDSDALQVVGANFMDPHSQPAAMREGLRQGRAEAENIRKSVFAY